MKRGLRVRPVKIEDAEVMCKEMKSDSLKNFSFFEEEVTLERQREYLARVIASTRDQLYAIMYFGKMIGTCGLHEIDGHNRNCRIGAMLFSKEFRGKGLGSEAIRQIVSIAFRHFGMHKAYLKVFAENTASCTKYAHLGFQFETLLREQYRLRGKYHDMVVMSMFARDWRAKQRSKR